jgi:CheY-like chemotaxis protein
MDLLRRAVGEQVEIEVRPDAGLWPAFVDPTQVESAVLNLAINARDAMPRGGRLTIETANRRLGTSESVMEFDALPGDYVMLAVADTGIGMSEETLSRVFEPFFTTKPQGRGTGLGLSMVYGFVKQSRGHIRIDSAVGRGTTVRLYLPRADAAHKHADALPASSELPRAIGEITVLVVEDNDDVRSIVVKQLTDLGYRVVDTENAAAALEVLREAQNPVHLLFSDIVMPGGMSGVELSRQARKLRPDLKVLLTSGFAEVAVRSGEPAGDAISFLSKPYRKHELARRIRETLAR